MTRPLVLTALALSLVIGCANQESTTSSSADEVNAGKSKGNTCEKPNPDLPVACAEVYAPVCGCNGVTYTNACEAEATVHSWTVGVCPSAPDGGVACKLAEPVTDRFCAEVWFPVCGCDGKTYGNACDASLWVTSSTPGECPAPSTDGGAPADGGACKLPSSAEPYACAEVYFPVCGCDGVTYTNPCEAEHAVTSWTTGACR